MNLTRLPMVDFQLNSIADLHKIADELSLEVLEFNDLVNKQGWSFIIVDTKVFGCNYRLA
jgi:hypothetical protein